MDEAADALMTRLGFLLGDKIISGEPGSSYHAQDDGQVFNSHTHIRVDVFFKSYYACMTIDNGKGWVPLEQIPISHAKSIIL